MNLLRLLIKPVPLRAAIDRDEPADEDTATGGTWLDSSYDLRRGLDVIELWPDTLPFAWPLEPMASST